MYDNLIIGSSLYGLYAAMRCGEAGRRVLVLECDSEPFKRATYINQARVHMGCHYLRSCSTAIKSAHYFERFCKGYGFCNLVDFDQFYATSANFSWTNAREFQDFCRAAEIRCDSIATGKFFGPKFVTEQSRPPNIHTITIVETVVLGAAFQASQC